MNKRKQSGKGIRPPVQFGQKVAGKRGARAGRFWAFPGLEIIEKLNIRGIIEVLDGKVVTVDKARGADKTFQKMLERISFVH